MDFSENVTRLEHEGREIYIVGTAHVSQRSVEEVQRVIDEVKPDTVCVELDQVRYEALLGGDQWRRLDIFEVIRQKKVLFVLASLALSSFQRRMAERLGIEPGAELKAAAEKAKEIGAELVLADRDIQATLKRTWANLTFWNKMQVLSILSASFFSNDEVTEEQIEKLKERDNISEAMKEFAKAMPRAQVPLIDERDRYLMSSITDAPGQRIVAVVGAGHVEGMVRYLGHVVDREDLARTPPPSPLSFLVKWAIPLVVLAAFYVGYRQHAGEGLAQMVYAWVLPNSIAAAVLAMAAGAKFLTVLTAFVGSPLTSLNPTVSAGMVAGFVEAWQRRPTVDDLDRMKRDMLTVGGVYRNRFTRVLLVAVLTTLGSALGAWIGATWVVTLL